MSLPHRLFAQCNRVYYPSEEKVEINLFLYNFSESPVIFSNIEIVFDFRTYLLNKEEFYVSPKSQSSIKYNFYLPSLEVGRKYFYIIYDLLYSSNNLWKKYERFTSTNTKNYFIEISSKREIANSQYIVFISRGLSAEDRTIGDFIAYNIRRWNFITRTVGIEVHATDQEASEKIKEEIKNANALIAIATPRNFNQLYQTWTTLDWLHSESAIGYGINKPLWIMQENGVELTALPKYLSKYGKAFHFLFTRKNELQIIEDINMLMPIFRESIKKDRIDTFFSELIEKGILVALGGLGGFFFGIKK